MKYAALLLFGFLLAACSDSPVASTTDASTDAMSHSDGSSDAGALHDSAVGDAAIADAAIADAAIADAAIADAAIADAAADAGESDAGAFDASIVDAATEDAAVDSSVSDGGAADGEISGEVSDFLVDMLAAQTNFTTAQCSCSWSTFGFESDEMCQAALAPEPINECYQREWSAHWDEMGPRMECIRAAHDAYYHCISTGGCGMENVSMCDDVHGTSFFACIDIATELSEMIDGICGV